MSVNSRWPCRKSSFRAIVVLFVLEPPTCVVFWLYLRHFCSDFKSNFTVEFSEILLCQTGWTKSNSRTQSFGGLGFTPRFVDIRWVETTNRHTFGVYTFHQYTTVCIKTFSGMLCTGYRKFCDFWLWLSLVRNMWNFVRYPHNPVYISGVISVLFVCLDTPFDPVFIQ